MPAGWDPVAGQFPHPPKNVTAMSAFHSTDTDIRWDDPSNIETGPTTAVSDPSCPPGTSNTPWQIIGVNIYRSDTGDRGPYFRVNQVPVGATFFRDRTNVAEVQAEIIPWAPSFGGGQGWIFRGDNPNSKAWTFRTRYRPMVKREGNAVPANSPSDVEVFVDGAQVPIVQVFGEKGEVDLSVERVWDPATENFIDPPIPTESSTVSIHYYYLKTPKLVGQLDDRWKVFYRITTVAIDPFGTSPSGLIETPLDYCEPVSPMNSERIDWIWREAIIRNRWILEQGGERVKLFIRRVNGNPCNCVWDPRLQAYSKQPLNMCTICYGTGWVGGYEGPYEIIIGPDDSERRVSQTPEGRRLEHTYEVWIGPSPMVSQRDFIVKQNGERYSIGPVRRTQIRGVTLQQTFQIAYLPGAGSGSYASGDIRYQVPMSYLERLPWPQTRYTRPEDSPCEDAPPYPVGADYQATPMMSEDPKIPDGREQRGRTPVFQHITSGGGEKS